MKRELLRQLVTWKENPERKPLILEGARQTGKTYLLKEIFGAEHYENVAYLNLQNPSQEVVNLFEGSIEPRRLLDQLEIILGVDIKPEKTLIFFDEIQEVPRALESLKYFCEQAPEYHVVSAGSLLGVFLHQGTSFPVGKVDTLRLEPLNFAEFLTAKGNERMVEYLRREPEDELLRSALMDELQEYLFVGGMPEAVRDWSVNHDLLRVEGVQRRILADYARDFSKHADDNLAWRIRQIFESLPAQFAKRNEKFLYGVVKEGARAREYELAIEWLVDAGIVRRVCRVQRGDRLPLRAYAERSAFKLYFLDLGLFRQLAGIPSTVMARKNAIFDEFNGLMAEQYVLQELAGQELFYWANEATAEVDFVGQFGEKIVPIEVKSGENVKAKSLRVYRERYRPELAVRFSLKSYEENGGLLNIPLYKSPVAIQLIQEKLTDVTVPSENV